MQNQSIPFQTIDWKNVPRTEHKGEKGSAYWQTVQFEGLRVRYERTLATIYVQNRNSGWVNVNERMVTLGHVWVMRSFYDHLPKERQDQLNRLERWARSKKVGLWKTPNPIPPWKWRNEE